MTTTMLDALKLIAGRSGDAMRDALKAIQAVNAGSPMVQQRYNQVAEIALNDASAGWTSSERQSIVAHIDAADSDTRDYSLRIRLTDSERDTLKRQSDLYGQTLSEYVRRMIFPATR